MINIILVLIVGLVAGATSSNATPSARPLSNYALQEIARAARAELTIDHGGDSWSRVASTGNGHELVQIVAVDGDLLKFAIPLSPSSARVTEFVAAEVPRRFEGAAWPSETPWVRVKLVDDLVNRQHTMTVAVARRLVFDGEAGWRAANVRVQRFLLRREETDRLIVRLMPADDDGVFRTLRVEQAERTGVLRVKPGHGDVLGFRVHGRRLIVATADQYERSYVMKLGEERIFFQHRPLPTQMRPTYVPAVRAKFPARGVPPGSPAACAADLLGQPDPSVIAPD